MLCSHATQFCETAPPPLDTYIPLAHLEVVARVRAAALLARLRRVHCLRALHEQVLQLERLDQVRVPYLVRVKGEW